VSARQRPVWDATENELSAGRRTDRDLWSDWQRDRLLEIERAFPGSRPPARQALLEAISTAIREAIAGGSPAALILVDLNDFSAINAAWGPYAGDEALAATVQRISAFVDERFGKASADLKPVAGRLDADHFVATIPNVESIAGLKDDVASLVRTLSQPMALGGQPVGLSARAAIVQVPGHARTLTSALGRGFRLLNGEARTRADGVALSEDVASRGISTAQLERDLAAALVTDDLFLVLQPKVEIATRRVKGAEALARWRHRGRGMIPPLDFIGMAEKSGLIFDLGLRILRDACRAADMLSSLEQTVAVNISAYQLAHPDFLGRFLEIVDREGVAPQRLEIEVTETAAMTGGERIMRSLESLRRCGIGIAIDDFGTGFSNLAALAALPADVLKIDRSLVVGSEKGKTGRALLEIAVQLGQTLELVTVAEGVETEAQFANVARLGCDLVQGHLTGAAAPVAEYAALYGTA
jgi:predicted signal transduction protein with EAL and GGDEF domain